MVRPELTAGLAPRPARLAPGKDGAEDHVGVNRQVGWRSEIVSRLRPILECADRHLLMPGVHVIGRLAVLLGALLCIRSKT